MVLSDICNLWGGLTFNGAKFHFFDDGITRDGWLTLLLMISVSLTHIPYWKEYFKK